MPDAYVIEVEGRTVGIVAREPGQDRFKFFSSSNDYNVMDGDHFADPGVAERAARISLGMAICRAAVKRVERVASPALTS